MSRPDDQRVFRALARRGLTVRRDGPAVAVSVASDPNAAPTEILLPASLRLEEKAVRQLADLASVHHPAGGPAGGRPCRV
ncbi:MAG: hypothetical protein ABMB14_29455, partial [Myxococcota bacterium]